MDKEMKNKTTIILGSPGTGKTTRLLNIMEEYIAAGVEPSRIGFLSFTKKAVTEAKERALNKFPELKPKDLNYFRTIHSLAYYQMNVNRARVITKENYSEFGNILGLELSGDTNAVDDDLYGMNRDDRYLFISNLSRITHRPLREVWEELADEELDWFVLERIDRGLKQYKNNRLLVDFTDMLVNFLEQGSMPELDILFVDEAQDNSPLQWDIVHLMSKHVKEHVYIGGDDDQAIYKWAGADVKMFIEAEGNVEVLNQSHRIPKAVHEIAMDIVNRITVRRPKEFLPRKEQGTVEFVYNLDSIDMSKGEWLLLARNGYMLKQYEEYCVQNGYLFDSVFRSPLKSPAIKAIRAYEGFKKGKGLNEKQLSYIKRYTTTHKDVMSYKGEDLPIWHEALDKISSDEREYIIACRRNGESFATSPRIRISTIHGVKGGEAENVVVMSDLSFKTYQEMNRDRDNEHRVFYVAVTRAKNNLYLIEPSTNMYYNI